jgi:hypothetical protein
LNGELDSAVRRNHDASVRATAQLDASISAGTALKPPAKRCFVGLFGLNRSLRWTAPSIRRNILGPLRSAGYDCFVAAHFNQPDVIHHPASGERRVKLRRRAINNLDIDLQWIEPQSEKNVAELADVALSVPFRDYPDPDGGTRRNILYQMHSLRRLGRMLGMLGPENFQVFLLLRPDIEYIDRLDVHDVDRIVDGRVDMVSPSWQRWEGLNDRFAFCNYRAAQVFLNRWDRVSEFCKQRQYLHPETLLHDAVTSAGLRVATTEQRALRVRATGETWAEGFRLGKVTRAKHRVRPFWAAISAN